MSGKRAAGSKASARASAARTGGGMASSDGHAGWQARMLSKSSSKVAAGNGLLPVTSSHTSTPAEKISLFSSGSWPWTCCGEKYAGVPSRVPARVSPLSPDTEGRVAASAPETRRLPSWVMATTGGPWAAPAAARSLASPKSSTLATPSRVIMTLAALTSRCRMPRWCAAASASVTATAASRARASGSGPWRSSSAAVWPSTSSMTR